MEKDASSQDEANRDQTRSKDCNKQDKASFHNCHEGETKKQFQFQF